MTQGETRTVSLHGLEVDCHIAGAGLDVFYDEPRVPEALRTLDNVVMTPHVGSTTFEIREGRKRMVLENLRAHFAGEALFSSLF